MGPRILIVTLLRTDRTWHACSTDEREKPFCSRRRISGTPNGGRKDTGLSGYITDIEAKTLENEHFREVLFTAERIQLVVMALPPGEEIGTETHADVDQFIRVEAGNGKAILNGKETDLADGSAVVIPAGTVHNIVNSSDSEPLKLYTIYSPPAHPDRTVHRDKAAASAYEAQHHP
jgi:mannose-6-phosphate isomerase-like protein (cupin superfamily)